MAARVKAKAGCRRCSFIRLHLICALPALAIMALFPQVAAGLGPHLPPPHVIAVAIPVVAIPAFVLRVLKWHRDGRPSR
jgi:hypothetical protein